MLLTNWPENKTDYKGKVMTLQVYASELEKKDR